nr:hypothetical protein [Thiohalocapsa sp. ML1]
MVDQGAIQDADQPQKGTAHLPAGPLRRGQVGAESVSRGQIGAQRRQVVVAQPGGCTGVVIQRRPVDVRQGRRLNQRGGGLPRGVAERHPVRVHLLLDFREQGPRGLVLHLRAVLAIRGEADARDCSRGRLHADREAVHAQQCVDQRRLSAGEAAEHGQLETVLRELPQPRDGLPPVRHQTIVRAPEVQPLQVLAGGGQLVDQFAEVSAELFR